MLDIKEIQGSVIEYKEEVLKLSEYATSYLESFTWCQAIRQGWLVSDFAYMLCIFKFEIEPAEGSGADNRLWVIVGDILPAYLDTIEYKTAHEALDIYCQLMEEWIHNVRKGESVANCYPVNVAPTIEHADMLASRINIIQSDFLPFV